mmetsp:Transcript_15463/g.47849  ORF Transcript_15463/g.47849 Transcript_15463/m.47849 type:complete len:435 (-) Transcript_15463:4513-5817(-)
MVVILASTKTFSHRSSSLLGNGAAPRQRLVFLSRGLRVADAAAPVRRPRAASVARHLRRGLSCRDGCVPDRLYSGGLHAGCLDVARALAPLLRGRLLRCLLRRAPLLVLLGFCGRPLGEFGLDLRRLALVLLLLLLEAFRRLEHAFVTAVGTAVAAAGFEQHVFFFPHARLLERFLLRGLVLLNDDGTFERRDVQGRRQRPRHPEPLEQLRHPPRREHLRDDGRQQHRAHEEDDEHEVRHGHDEHRIADVLAQVAVVRLRREVRLQGDEQELVDVSDERDERHPHRDVWRHQGEHEGVGDLAGRDQADLRDRVRLQQQRRDQEQELGAVEHRDVVHGFELELLVQRRHGARVGHEEALPLSEAHGGARELCHVPGGVRERLRRAAQRVVRDVECARRVRVVVAGCVNEVHAALRATRRGSLGGRMRRWRRLARY